MNVLALLLRSSKDGRAQQSYSKDLRQHLERLVGIESSEIYKNQLKTEESDERMRRGKYEKQQ